MITGQNMKALKLSEHKELEFFLSVGFQGSFHLARVSPCRLESCPVISLSRIISPLLKQGEKKVFKLCLNFLNSFNELFFFF